MMLLGRILVGNDMPLLVAPFILIKGFFWNTLASDLLRNIVVLKCSVFCMTRGAEFENADFQAHPSCRSMDRPIDRDALTSTEELRLAQE
jgi:hypothetical protein